MSKDEFGKTEGRLYRYFENISKISMLEKEIEELDKRYENVDDILKNSSFDFDISLGSPGFEERVQTSCSGESAIEKQILNQAERLIKEQKIIRKKQFKYMSKERKMATAYHEAGHCIIQHYAPELREYYNVLAVSIMPAENYLGVNVFEQNENSTLPDNKNFYIQTIARLLGGRIAEKKYTGQLSAGASSDLEKATKIAKDMVTRYGLDEDFAQNRVYLKNTENSMYTESIKEKINGEIDKILEEAYKIC